MTLDKDLTAAAVVALTSGEHGDFRGFDAVWASLANLTDPALVAWKLSLHAVRWSFDPTAVATPDPADALHIAKSLPPDAAQALARACSVIERAYIAALDRAALERWLEVHETLPPQGGEAEAVNMVSLSTARLWKKVLAGEAASEAAHAKDMFESASRLRAAGQVIESTVLRSLLALSAGEVDPAVEWARRASRMAQAESLPQLEYLANLTLARVRRYSGRPHLALHILGALSRVAPPIWSGWIAWEVTLAGGDPIGQRFSATAPLAQAPAMLAARELGVFLRQVREDPTGPEKQSVAATFAAHAQALRERASCWADLSQETETLTAALDVRQEAAPSALEPWRRGQTTAIPYGLHAIGIPRGQNLEAETATAFVVARPNAEGRRMLRPGLALNADARVLTREAAKNAAAGVRTETGIAALALAGPSGLSREDFFRTVYGFSFVPLRHQAVLDVLCHRMRHLLGDAGELRRDGGDGANAGIGASSGPSLALILRETIVVPDMRCALPTADRVLRALATLGTTSASVAAESLRMPLRTVQAILQQLVAEGSCTVEREGRRVNYRIEDTTFTEVTAA